jgi:hypothetical protein
MVNGNGMEHSSANRCKDHIKVSHTGAVSGAASFHERQERKEMVRCSRG